MRVLYFAPRIAWPIISGAHLRDFYFAKYLADKAELTYVGLVTEEGEKQAELLRGQLGQRVQVIAVQRDTAYRRSNIVRGMIGPTPLNVLNFTSPRVLAEVERIFREQSFDTVQVESMHLIAYARRIRQLAPQTRLILDWHNIESEILARYAEKDSNPLRRIYAQRTSTLSRGVEDELLRLCHAHTVCSEREREGLHARVPGARIEVVGNGVDCEFFAVNSAPVRERRDVLFMGRMDYHANVDAALFFVDAVWPLIQARRPELRLVIVGAQPAKAILALRGRGITVTGTVDDVRPYYQSALTSVVPLRVGGGTRLKVLEAMAAGTPVISTTLGAEGLAITPGKDILIADSPQAMAETVVSLRAGSPQWSEIASNGHRLVETTYDWSVVGEILWQLHTELVSSGAATVR
ncbi:MAG TPA: glycosyltransferase [Terriglobales bacterium]|jgi:sugar transferase (PEP-CTERM/EpsH1 system associated)|nr:glycosyltransferase [Terriglobales bacterium]